MPKIEKKCSYCGNSVLKYKSQLRNPDYCFCNIICKGKYQKENAVAKGKNNPNYGKRWSDDKRLALSKKVKKRYEDNPEYRHISGSANRGQKFSEERIKRMHENRSSKSYSHPHSEESKKIIGTKSAQKFTTEFNQRLRKTMEVRGHWVALQDKSRCEIYYKESNWKEQMINLITDEMQISLLRKIGMFNCRTNTRGMVRDHMYSRRSGFEEGVFPEILRHPANCKLITNPENTSKKKYRYIDDNSFTKEELFDRIIKYDGKPWKEHDIALQRIDEYVNKNMRWDKKLSEQPPNE